MCISILRKLGKALRASEIRFKTPDLRVLQITEDDINEDIAHRGNC